MSKPTETTTEWNWLNPSPRNRCDDLPTPDLAHALVNRSVYGSAGDALRLHYAAARRLRTLSRERTERDARIAELEAALVAMELERDRYKRRCPAENVDRANDEEANRELEKLYA